MANRWLYTRGCCCLSDDVVTSCIVECPLYPRGFVLRTGEPEPDIYQSSKPVHSHQIVLNNGLIEAETAALAGTNPTTGKNHA